MLKTKTIATANATVLAVEVEEGVKAFDYSRAGVSFLKGDGSNLFISGKWQLLGRLPELTEQIFYNIMEGDPDILPFTSWREDFEKLLQANEVYFENKYRETIPYGFEEDAMERQLWRTAQFKVWDKERTYLFIKGD